MAHLVIARRRSNSVAFRAKRTFSASRLRYRIYLDIGPGSGRIGARPTFDLPAALVGDQAHRVVACGTCPDRLYPVRTPAVFWVHGCARNPYFVRFLAVPATRLPHPLGEVNQRERDSL
jgi:hypothetical protein